MIPHVRPELTSRPVEHILDEVRRLVDNGYREIVLTGIHLGHYGVDWNWNRPRQEWTRLSDLLAQIIEVDDCFRVRLSSIEATELTRPLLDLLVDHPQRICPHLHVCLQSGSDSVLRRMRRRWSSRSIIERCQLVQQLLVNPALTTDVIVGFPAETDEEFQQTLDTVSAIGFSKVHAFPFSARRGTPAAEMDGQLSKSVKKARSKQLQQLALELKQQYYRSLLGQPLELLVESSQDGQTQGTSCRYAPVRLPGTDFAAGSLVPVVANELDQQGLLATPTDQSL